MKFFLIFNLLFNQFSMAQSCRDCEPLAEVSLTNNGLEKLISISVDESLDELEKTVFDKANFRPVVLDKSHCKTKTISEAWKDKKKEDCFGLPEFKPNSTGEFTMNTKLRPYQAKIENWSLNKIDLELAKPVKCHNFVCDFEIKTNKLDISGELSVNYTDKNEVFIPPTKLNLRTTEKNDIRMTGQALIEPKTGQINDLIFLNEDKTKIDIKENSLYLDMDIKTEYPSKAEESRIRSKNFHRYVDVSKITPDYVEQQYNYAYSKLIFETEKEIENKRKSADLSPLPWEQQRKLAEKQTNELISAKYGSVDKFKSKLHAIKWPKPEDEQATFEFLKNPPSEIIVFRDITDKMDFADTASIGENSGFDNANAFFYSMAAINISNQAAQIGFVNQDFIQPLVSKEVLPAVQSEVNKTLRNLRHYWSKISEIPNLNAQNLQVLSDLNNKLSETKGESEKESLRKKIAALKEKMASDWTPIDTTVSIDKNTRDQKLLKAQITKSSPECQDYPKKYSDDTDTDFDMRTQVGVNTLQEYFNRMAENKNLDLCTDSEEPGTCKKGKKINLKNPPKIGCANGQYTFEFDAEGASRILGVEVDADVGANIKAQVNNCSGSPCIQFTDGSGHFKNVFLNTFFGSMIDHAVTNAMAQTNNTPINVPHTKMKKSQTSPTDCVTKIDWDLEK